MFGAVNENGTWSGLIGELIEQVCIAILDIYFSQDNHGNHFSFTFKISF